jgi:hypothetical protein
VDVYALENINQGIYNNRNTRSSEAQNSSGFKKGVKFWLLLFTADL